MTASRAGIVAASVILGACSCSRPSSVAPPPATSADGTSASPSSSGAPSGASAPSIAAAHGAGAPPLAADCPTTSPDVHLVVTFMAGFPPPLFTLHLDGRAATLAEYDPTPDGVVGEFGACVSEADARALAAAFPAAPPPRPPVPDTPVLHATSTGGGQRREWVGALPASGGAEAFSRLATAMQAATLAHPRSAVRLSLVRVGAAGGDAVARLDNPGDRPLRLVMEQGPLVVQSSASPRHTGTPLTTATSLTLAPGAHVDLARFPSLPADARARYAGSLELQGTALEGPFTARLESGPL